jgi:NADPH:quinone reductase
MTGRARHVASSMDTIRALVADPTGPGHLSMQEVEAPTPSAHEAIVAVEAVSLNRGEVRALQSADAGWRPGWDLAGTIMQAAADGTGPTLGTRVVGLAALGAWAERATVPTELLTPIPDRVDAAKAATLPVAGLTALRAVEMADTVENRAVLVTGASGGVGRFAVQLAAQLGADVTALVSSEERGRPLVALGAARVVTAVAEDDTFDVILESVGGDVLGQALHSIGTGGLIVSFGNSSGAPSTFDVTRFYRRGGARLYAFALRNELARSGSGALDLARLVGMVADGHLDVGIEREAPWSDAASVVDAFLRREITGKAVLHIS